jgi:fucose 4-O-acetylase-like acetyltransferase
MKNNTGGYKNMDKNQHKLRLHYLDYAKGLGILLIVFGHVVQNFNNIKSIESFINYEVSIFFVVSGGLFLFTDSKNLPFNKYFQKKIQSLVIPYILFSIINSVMKLGVLFITNKLNNQTIKDEITAFLITGNGTVWFLITLFIIEICFYLIYHNIKKDVYKYILAILLAIIPFLITRTYNVFLIFALRILLGLGYYIFGYWFFKYIKQYEGIPLYIGVIFVCIGILLSRFGVVESYFGGYYKNIVITIPSNLFNICGWIFIFMNVKRRFRLLLYIGKNSLLIMLLHPIILLFFTYPFSKLFTKINLKMQITTSTMMFIFIILIEIPCIFIVNKYFPFIIGKKKKIDVIS